MKGYNESYLDDAMHNLGDMVEYAVCDLGFDPDVFFGYFLASGIADSFGCGNPKYIAGMSGEELACAVLNALDIPHRGKTKTHTPFRGVEYWAGWILAYYQWTTGQRFEDIAGDGLPLSTIFSMYILHEADVTKFVDAADDILRRKRETSRSKLSQIRKARRFTQSQLSDASGISLRMIQLYEQRQNDISKAQVDTVLALARALGCGVEDVLE